MCTVTFIARKQGYALGMNRDELLTRAVGLPPKIHKAGGRTLLYPSEPGGGTWMALNDTGVTLALINWYSVTARAKGQPVSRGEVVKAVSMTVDPAQADACLQRLPLKQMNPFRLIGIYPDTKEIVEWRWDLQKLVCKHHPWRAQQWISSGFDEPTAQRVRSRTFRVAQKQKSAGTLDWLRRLHRSHSPERGAFSTCMHRTDAATVSYTEVSVSLQMGVMRYHGKTPCEQGQISIRRIVIAQ